ncbi:MAG: DUF4160 domain-containing protein [Cellulosilyticaceae bacterium]
MLVITRFYGMVIKMYPNDHVPPHFHVIYNEYNGVFSIEELEMIEGDLPNKAKRMILEWAEMYKVQLLQMWNTKEFVKLPPLE